MRILFDQGTPVPLRKLLPMHQVETAFERGWATYKNGELLHQAEEHGFDVLVTTDTNMAYQQNLSKRKIALVVLSTTSWPRIRAFAANLVLLINSAKEKGYAEVKIP